MLCKYFARFFHESENIFLKAYFRQQKGHLVAVNRF